MVKILGLGAPRIIATRLNRSFLEICARRPSSTQVIAVAGAYDAARWGVASLDTGATGSRLRSSEERLLAGRNWYLLSRAFRSAICTGVSCRRRLGFRIAATLSKSSTWNRTFTPSSPSCTTRTHGRAARRRASRAPPVGARSQQFAAVGIDVPVLARNCQQPRIVDAAAFAVLGGVGLVVGDAVAFAESGF